MVGPKGIKRASPGADTKKEGPIALPELSEEDGQKIREVSRELERVELAVELLSQEKHTPVWEKRRQILKAIPRFWPIALLNHPLFAMHAAHTQDQMVLNYLEDMWITRNPEEKRCFTIEFYFKENPYFSNTVLKKEYKYIPPAPIDGDKPDENGITTQMLEFAWDLNVEPQAFKIDWKDDTKNLTKIYPQVILDHVGEDDELPAEPGSLFNYFETANDPYDLGIVLANEVFPEIIDYFSGNPNQDDDSDEEDSEDDDDNEDEIDLEKPRSKK